MRFPIIKIIIAAAIGYTAYRLIFDDSNPKKNEPSHVDLTKMTDVGRKIGAWLRDNLLPSGLNIVSQMTYSQAIGYFVEHRPSDVRVVKGAMLLQEHSKGRLLIQVFLDENNEVVSGRRLIVQSLDTELQQTFGGKDLIIVE